MQSITDFWNQLLSHIPNVVLALLILILAFLVAWIAKKLTLKLFRWLGVERLLAKSGVDKKHIGSTKSFVAKVVQLTVFVLFLPGIFQKLGMDSTATPIVTMMNGLMAYLPNIVAGMLVLIVGLFIAKIVKELVYPLVKRAKLNAWLERVGVKSKIDIADIVATATYVVIAIVFIVEALNTLQLEILTQVGNAIMAYLPFALSALLVLGVVFILGKYVEVLMVSKLKTNKTVALATRIAIIIVGVFMSLDQLGIAKTTVNSAFIIILGGVMVAVALAFGFGGKDFAARTLKKLESHINKRK